MKPSVDSPGNRTVRERRADRQIAHRLNNAPVHSRRSGQANADPLVQSTDCQSPTRLRSSYLTIVEIAGAEPWTR